jgi:hypothetical protein
MSMQRQAGATPRARWFAKVSLAAEAVLRYVWHSPHGAILIEVRDGTAYVNGQRVEPVLEAQRRLDEINGPAGG